MFAKISHDKTQFKKVDVVNVWSATGRPASSGSDCHVPKVAPNRHQASARKMKLKTTIATWDLRTMLQKGELDKHPTRNKNDEN